MKTKARIKLIGNLGHAINPSGSDSENLQEVLVNVPVKLGTAIRKLEQEHGLSLHRDSILILVNGVVANALEDLDTMIEENDQIVLVPMFHGGSTG